MFVGVYFADLLGRGKQVQLGVIMPQSVIFCTFLTCLIYFKSKLFSLVVLVFGWEGGGCSRLSFVVFVLSLFFGYPKLWKKKQSSLP